MEPAPEDLLTFAEPDADCSSFASTVAPETVNDLETTVRNAASQVLQLCATLEKQSKILRDSLSAASSIASQLGESSVSIRDTFPDISKWLEKTSHCASDVNILYSTMIRSWTESLASPISNFLRESMKELKNISKKQAKALASYESAQIRVKLCRDKGKQTNMMKLMELEQERDSCSKSAELWTLNKTSALKKLKENMQLEMFQGIYNLMDSQSECFRCGNEMFATVREDLPDLQNMISQKKEAITSDVMKYVADQLKMNVASDLAKTTEERLATPPPNALKNTVAPLTELPEEVQTHFLQFPPRFAVSTSGKLKNSAQEAEIDLSVSPADFTIINLKDKSTIQRNVDQLLQVSRAKNSAKLKIQWKQRDKPTDLLFADKEQRERCYEAISFAANIFKENCSTTEEDIRIWTGSWNMGDAPPPPDLEDLGKWIPTSGFDLYVIGTQECEYKPKGMEDPENTTGCEADWFGRIQSLLGTEYIRVCGLSLMSIRMIVLVHRSKWFNISNVKKTTEACGIANIIGNKGAVGVAFNFNETRLIFINSHLAAHMSKWEERNANYRQIVANLKLTSSNPCYLTNYYHYVFWMGDLNYRIDDKRETVMEKIKNEELEHLFLNDQLTRERVWGNAFAGFSEATLTFPPTYRYHRGSNEYSEEKLRVPSWCDRILWKTLPNCSIIQENYTSTETILTSDHHPISCEFRVETKKPNFPHIPQKTCRVLFSDLEVSGLEFKEGSIGDTSLMLICDAFQQNFVSSVVTKSSLPKWDVLTPIEVITTNKEYLEQEYIFVIVREHGKKKEQNELGQSVISLAGACDGEPIRFDCKLQYRGKLQGKLKGSVHVSWEKEHDNAKSSYSMDAFTKKKGYLLKQQQRRRKWDRKWFVLANFCLYYYPSESTTKLSGSLSMRNAKVIDLGNDKKFSFRVETQKKTLTLSSGTLEDKEDWMALLSEAAGCSIVVKDDYDIVITRVDDAEYDTDETIESQFDSPRTAKRLNWERSVVSTTKEQPTLAPLTLRSAISDTSISGGVKGESWTSTTSGTAKRLSSRVLALGKRRPASFIGTERLTPPQNDDENSDSENI